jgi:protein SDA1
MPEDLLKSFMDDYKHHREKGPMNAARSLLSLYREINPELLKKKDRGKNATINMKNFVPAKYGQVKVADTIEGLDVY